MSDSLHCPSCNSLLRDVRLCLQCHTAHGIGRGRGHAKVECLNDEWHEAVARSVPSTPSAATKKCEFGDPACPCQDGDMCHYKGDNPFPQPAGLSSAAPSERDIEVAREIYAVFDSWLCEMLRFQKVPDAVQLIPKIASLLAARAAAPQNDRWVPVSERLPEPGSCAIVYGYADDSEKIRIQDMATYSYMNGWHVGAAYERQCEFVVTHWQPLPAPPVSDSESAREEA
jgi:hypothetical protein